MNWIKSLSLFSLLVSSTVTMARLGFGPGEVDCIKATLHPSFPQSNYEVGGKILFPSIAGDDKIYLISEDDIQQTTILDRAHLRYDYNLNSRRAKRIPDIEGRDGDSMVYMPGSGNSSTGVWNKISFRVDNKNYNYTIIHPDLSTSLTTTVSSPLTTVIKDARSSADTSYVRFVSLAGDKEVDALRARALRYMHGTLSTITSSKFYSGNRYNSRGGDFIFSEGEKAPLDRLNAVREGLNCHQEMANTPSLKIAGKRAENVYCHGCTQMNNLEAKKSCHYNQIRWLASEAAALEKELEMMTRYAKNAYNKCSKFIQYKSFTEELLKKFPVTLSPSNNESSIWGSSERKGTKQE